MQEAGGCGCGQLELGRKRCSALLLRNTRTKNVKERGLRCPSAPRPSRQEESSSLPLVTLLCQCRASLRSEEPRVPTSPTSRPPLVRCRLGRLQSNAVTDHFLSLCLLWPRLLDASNSASSSVATIACDLTAHRSTLNPSVIFSHQLLPSNLLE